MRTPHDHTFGQDQVKPGERRTFGVIALTAVTMVVEIVAGLAYGSMALLADGLHMASHAAALSVAAVAYVYARRRASDPRYSFGTGKVNALAGFSSAVLLGVFALFMAWESIARLIDPVEIAFEQAILVACIGLAVNVASLFILGGGHAHGGHDHDHGHGHDHNLKAASFHVLADALTSVLAILALVAGRFWGAAWLDPTMGIVGSLLIARWGYGLLRETGHVLLDRRAQTMEHRVREVLEARDDNHVDDLHVWAIGPEMYAAAICLTTPAPQCPEHYRELIPEELGVVHATVEVHHAAVGIHRAELERRS